MFVIRFFYIFILIKLNCWHLKVQSLPSAVPISTNNNSVIDNNNTNINITDNLEIKLKRTAVNITQINDMEVQSNDFMPRFHLSSLKAPRGFLTLNPVTTLSISPQQNAPIHFYPENRLVSLNKLTYNNLGKFLISQLPNAQHIEESNVNNILGSGDFGVVQGGTFYPPEEMPHHIKNHHDYYRGDPTAIQIHEETTSSDGLIHKYTTADKQFERFHDFADLNSPNMDTDFTKYIVIYAANHINRNLKQNLNLNLNGKVKEMAEIKCHNENDIDSNDVDNKHVDNKHNTMLIINDKHHYPENIYEELLKIDEDKLKKQFPQVANSQSFNENALKLITNSWLMKNAQDISLSKKKSNDLLMDDKDPLLALS